MVGSLSRPSQFMRMGVCVDCWVLLLGLLADWGGQQRALYVSRLSRVDVQCQQAQRNRSRSRLVCPPCVVALRVNAS
ncbi:hypothetical protein B0T14DRAFT_502346 [Immersiella caudata]|uniref:Secreted protein n=1 Tax=Immersiella caudata TaxID=314043 RepID=A0AA40CB18_9PEZI|nr:hypothetical protein B0T14DRAFT_502346 [Immersiella caudata]